MNNITTQFRPYLALSWYSLKAAIRNKATLFFSLIFPIVLVVAFGLIGSSNQSFKIGLIEGKDEINPIVATVKKISAVKTTTASLEELNGELKRGKLDAVLKVDPSLFGGYQVTVYTSNANPTTSGAVASLVKGIVDQGNLRATGVTNNPISFSSYEVTGRQSRYIDFILPGQVGFSLLSIALFTTVFGFIALRRLLVLKRLFATPTRPITILLSQGTSKLIMALLQTTIIVGFGVLVFNFYLPHGWVTFLEIMVLSVLGLISFLGFGFFLSGLANDENSAPPLVNVVSLPQMLLSGVFFPTESLPTWIQPVANNLPLAYFNQAIRKITTEGGNFSDTIPYVVGFMLWGVVMYALATRTFKWE
ncbi:MAG: ABC transporter permease [Candidatus Levybacteria bacterium]|nr:ABC transporter permease [Candidatus Levybacteria bacterium]